MLKVFITISILFLFINLVSAGFGYDNPNIPKLVSGQNYSTVNVNNSQYLQGYSPTNLPVAYYNFGSNSFSGTGNFATEGIMGIGTNLSIGTYTLQIGNPGRSTTIYKYGILTSDHFFVGTTGAFRVQRSSAGSEAFRTQVNGDTQGRWIGTSDGRLSWGGGSAVTDVEIRREKVNQLWLNGSLNITQEIIVGKNITINPLAGTGNVLACLDSTGKLYRGNTTGCP